jgi:hypothetical protein
LGAKSPSFEQFLAAKCGWNNSLEPAVYKGERTMDDLKEVWACSARLTQPAAHQALASALAARQVNASTTDETRDKSKAVPPCHKKGTADPKTEKCPGKPPA